MTIIPLVRDGGKESGYIIFKAEKMNISCFCLVSFIPTVTYNVNVSLVPILQVNIKVYLYCS